MMRGLPGGSTTTSVLATAEPACPIATRVYCVVSVGVTDWVPDEPALRLSPPPVIVTDSAFSVVQRSVVGPPVVWAGSATNSVTRGI